MQPLSALSRREISLRRSNSVLFGLAIAAAGTRGIVEAVFGRSIAYVVQLFFICGPLLLIEYRSRRVDPGRRWLPLRGPAADFGWVIFLSVVSMFVTPAIHDAVGFQYILVLLFTWLLLAFAVQQLRRPTLDFTICFWSSTLIACFLAVVGVLQQLLIFPFELPGYTNLFDVIRPPSLTASYLHYPLIIAIAACNCYVAVLNGKRLALLPMVFLVLATFGSFSRSGMLILFAAFGLSMFTDRRQFVRSLVVIGATLALLFAMSTLIDSSTISLVDRLTSSVDTQSDGNDTRSAIWTNAIDKLNWLNVGIGTYFGLITNSASEELRDLYGIVESSPMQQILNIGLIGTVVFYLSFYRLARRFPKADRYSGFVLAAAAVQSAFYQSIEVIPFLVMIMATAVFAATFQNETTR